MDSTMRESDGTSTTHKLRRTLSRAFLVLALVLPFLPGAADAAVSSGKSHLMLSGDRLLSNEKLVSGNGLCVARMKPNGNFVIKNRLYSDTWGVNWETNTAGNPGSELWLRRNGQLGIQGLDGDFEWTSGTAGNHGANLRLTNTCQLRLSLNGETLWETPEPPLPLGGITTGAGCSAEHLDQARDSGWFMNARTCRVVDWKTRTSGAIVHSEKGFAQLDVSAVCYRMSVSAAERYGGAWYWAPAPTGWLPAPSTDGWLAKVEDGRVKCSLWQYTGGDAPKPGGINRG